MNNIYHIIIWNREFDLELVCQNYTGEPVTEAQKEAINSIDNLEFDTALLSVKSYIMENYAFDNSLCSIDNIFKYVIPKQILIVRNTELRTIALMCKFKYDIEHGLAIVFENEKFVAVGPQDIIL